MTDLHQFADVLAAAAKSAPKMAEDALTAVTRVIQDDSAFGEPVVANFTGRNEVHLSGIDTSGVVGTRGSPALSDFNPRTTGENLGRRLLEGGTAAVTQ